MYAAQQSSIDPALAALMQTAQMVTPEGTDTVAKQVAQAAVQKMQPQGIAQGMPQARQEFQQAMPSMMRNMQQAQMQQMIQQAMQPKPVGIEGVQSNIRPYREGGIIGYSGLDGSVVDTKLMRMTPEEYERRRREAMARGVPPERIRRTPEEEVIFSGLSAVPPMQEIPVPEVVSAPVVAPEAQRLMDRQRVPAPRPPAQRPPAPAPVAPSTGVAQLVEPQFRGEGIPQAGKEFLTDAEQRIARMQAIEDQRAAAKAAMPDLNAQGIAALQKAEEERKRLLGIEQSDDARRRWAGVFRGWGGDRDAYDRIVGGINQRDALANQAQLGFEQAKIKLQQAQQAESLGQFDRKLAFEKEAAELTNKARDDMLKARQIESVLAANLYSTEANIYGTKSSTQQRGLDRAQQAKIEGARLQQQAEQNGQMQLANRINAANMTVASAYDKLNKALAPYATFARQMETMPDMLKLPANAAQYQKYLDEKARLEKTIVHPAEEERDRLARMINATQDLSKWGTPKVKAGG